MCHPPNPRILYVDNDLDGCELIGLMIDLDIPGYAFTAVSTASEAFAVIETEPIALFILDYALPQMSGVELCRLIRQTDKQTINNKNL